MKRLVLLLAVALLGAGCGEAGRTPSPSTRAEHEVTPELTHIAQLRAAFDAHPGVPRLIVLASPT